MGTESASRHEAGERMDPQERKGMGMLVLSRNKGETIVVGDDVRITVIEIRGDKVRLGIEADKQTPVHRQEVYDAIQREKREEE
jgi:carbon storage regulator